MFPFFSITIPVYNVTPYLCECLDSVLAQTFTDWEAICVDDGSTDGSGFILDEYMAKDDWFVLEFMFRRSRLKKIGGFVNFQKAWYSDEATWGLMAANGCANFNERHFLFLYSGVNISTSYAKIFDLADASWQYHGWARTFLSGLVPTDEAEYELLEGAKKCLTDRVLGLIHNEMSPTSNAEWVKVMIQSSIPFAWKLRCLKDSIRRKLRYR